MRAASNRERLMTAHIFFFVQNKFENVWSRGQRIKRKLRRPGGWPHQNTKQRKLSWDQIIFDRDLERSEKLFLILSLFIFEFLIQALNLFIFLEFSIRFELNFELIPFTYDRGHVKDFFPCFFLKYKRWKFMLILAITQIWQL